MMYEVEEADEDLNWMVYEIERLREENQRLQEHHNGQFRERQQG
jgi:hypothetical protein